ncbi:hypothetical protein C7A10_19390 [Pseudomonas fluorescens]|uniref:Uncharacterized protein n=1 Tax=Pseudomonas fluorescens TaxID=294 RepID=A0A2T0I3M0_PSEFL|nr:hypothetical protein C7A10_19390 [Pseudomonas fluorescens]
MTIDRDQDVTNPGSARAALGGGQLGINLAAASFPDRLQFRLLMLSFLATRAVQQPIVDFTLGVFGRLEAPPDVRS